MSFQGLSESPISSEEVQLRWRQLQQWFTEADTDGSSELSLQEMAAVVRTLYREVGVSRSERKVLAETAEAIKEYDEDGSGSLGFLEFVQMVACSPMFKLRMSEEVCTSVLHLIECRPNEACWRRQGRTHLLLFARRLERWS